MVLLIISIWLNLIDHSWGWKIIGLESHFSKGLRNWSHLIPHSSCCWLRRMDVPGFKKNIGFWELAKWEAQGEGSMKGATLGERWHHLQSPLHRSSDLSTIVFVSLKQKPKIYLDLRLNLLFRTRLSGSQTWLGHWTELRLNLLFRTRLSGGHWLSDTSKSWTIWSTRGVLMLKSVVGVPSSLC